MAEGIFQHLAKINPDVPVGRIDSSGTDSYHIGSEPDSRTMEVLNNHLIGPYVHRAQQLASKHFGEFDIVVGMDQRNHNFILSRSEFLKKEAAKMKEGSGGGAVPKQAKVGVLGDFSSSGKREYVRDPYYMDGGFESTYVQVRQLCENLLEAIRNGTWKEKLE